MATRQRRNSLRIIGPSGLAAFLWAVAGCQAPTAPVEAIRTVHARPVAPLVMPSAATLAALGEDGLLCAEMQVLNSRKDIDLGADLPPAVAPVNLSQVYIRDQQWILNGRPWENYFQTTRSLQLRSR